MEIIFHKYPFLFLSKSPNLLRLKIGLKYGGYALIDVTGFKLRHDC